MLGSQLQITHSPYILNKFKIKGWVILICLFINLSQVRLGTAYLRHAGLGPSQGLGVGKTSLRYFLKIRPLLKRTADSFIANLPRILNSDRFSCYLCQIYLNISRDEIIPPSRIRILCAEPKYKYMLVE